MSTSLVGMVRQLARENARVGGALLPNPRAMTGYVPLPLQTWIEERMRRFNAIVLHRRFGKTVMEVNKLVERALECPFDNGRYAYIAPTYSQAEDIAWTYLDEFTKGIPGREVQTSKLAVWVPTYRGSRARIRLYGVDSPKQRIRGLYLDGVVLDEWPHIPPSVFTSQIRPMLSDKQRRGVDDTGFPNQWADFIFTPQGRDHAYTTYHRADLWARGLPVMDGPEGRQREVFRSDWFACLMKASETGLISAEELEDALRDMGRSKFEQEYECSFDAAIEGAIFAKELEDLKARGRITEVPYIPFLPVNTAWDLGIDDATAIWFFQDVGMECRIIDYYEMAGMGLEHYASVLAERKYRYGYNLLPHDVEVTEIGSGKSRASILRRLGVRVHTVPRTKKQDQIAAAQALLPMCAFDASRCAEGLDRLSMYQRVYDERLGRFQEKPLHNWASHGADAFETLAVGRKRWRHTWDLTDFSRAEY